MNKKYLLSQLSASELRKRLVWKCPLKGHRKHDGISHHTCYDRLRGTNLKEKIAFFDIEAEDLKADYGIAFCWVLLDSETNKMYSDAITLNDIKKYSSREKNTQPKEDTRIIKSLISRMSCYDRVIGHFSAWYDLPFIRTRAVIDKLDFPAYGALYQGDSWKILRAKFKLSRNTLENASLKLTGKTRKDHLSLSIKHGCLRGEQWALKKALIHCENDVLDLRDVFNAICFSTKITNTSI